MKVGNLKDINKRRIISSVRASMEMAGLNPSSYALNIGKQYLENRISSNEAIKMIKVKHSSKFGQ